MTEQTMTPDEVLEFLNDLAEPDPNDRDVYPAPAAFRTLRTAVAALIARNAALEAVLYLHECPSCGVEWSEGECEQMIHEKSASCICGYRQELARAEAGHG